jgi:hypothetical protein
MRPVPVSSSATRGPAAGTRSRPGRKSQAAIAPAKVTAATVSDPACMPAINEFFTAAVTAEACAGGTFCAMARPAPTDPLPICTAA